MEGVCEVSGLRNKLAYFCCVHEESSIDSRIVPDYRKKVRNESKGTLGTRGIFSHAANGNTSLRL